MPQPDLYILMGIGGFFIILGIVAIIWGRAEEKVYYNSMARRPDTREFLEHWPHRPQFDALKIGGRILLTIGVLMIVAGGGIWLWG